MAEKSDVEFQAMLDRISRGRMKGRRTRTPAGKQIIVGRVVRNRDWLQETEDRHEEIHSQFPHKNAS